MSLRDPSLSAGGATRTRAFGLALALSAALASSSGCSLFLTKGPPPKSERAAAFTCTDSPVLPVVDIGLSVLSLAETIHAAAKDRTPWPWVGGAVVFGVSGALGAGRANACNAAHGHPYRPHPPAVQGGMMPEEPFGLRGAHPQKPPAPGDDEDEDDDDTGQPKAKGAAPAKVPAKVPAQTDPAP